MRKKKENPLPLPKKPQGLLQPFYFNSFFKRFHIHSGDPEELNGHHPQILKGLSGNGTEFPLRLLFTESDMKILKGHLPTLPIQTKKHASQLLPAPKGKALREKVNRETESSEDPIDEKGDHI